MANESEVDAWRAVFMLVKYWSYETSFSLIVGQCRNYWRGIILWCS